MSLREQPFFGHGKFSARGVAKLNQLARRMETYGANSTSPMMSTASGTIPLLRRHMFSSGLISVKHPWKIYRNNPPKTGEPPVLPDTAWRTFSVHAGELNGEVARRGILTSDKYSTDDDTTGGENNPILITLSADAANAIWVRQTLTLDGDDWVPDKTYIETSVIDPGFGEVTGWPGFERGYDGGTDGAYNGSNDPIEQPVRNVIFKWIGVVTLGSDDEGETYHKTKIDQVLDANVTQISRMVVGEPYPYSEDPADILSGDWKQFKVHSVTVNDIHALFESQGYGDDTDTDGSAIMTGSEGIAFCVFVQQTVDESKAVDETFLDFSPWSSYARGTDASIAFEARVAKVTIGQTDTLTAADYMQFKVQVICGVFWYELSINGDLELYWNGVLQATRPATPRGELWEVVSVDGHKIYMESRCLSFEDIPGSTPYAGVLSLNTDESTALSVTFTAGLCNAAPGTVLQIGTGSGTTVSITVGAGGELTGYVGVVAIGDPATGTTSYYRISSTGLLEA